MQSGIVIFSGGTVQVQQSAEALAARLGLPVIEPPTVPASMALAFVDDRLELRDGSMRAGRGLSVEFGRADGRPVRLGSIRRQPLARAVGEASTLLDATAGLGRDTWLLAAMGYNVIAAERSPIVAALLVNGLERARRSSELNQKIVSRISVIEADARDLMAQSTGQFDVIFIDPMFPPKRKATALAKRSVRLLREVVGDDPDAESLVNAALRHAGKRAVVKRADEAPFLGDKPSFSVPGKVIRYDVYLARGGGEAQ